MGITGVGSSYNFVYNTKTGKLSTKDGSKDVLDEGNLDDIDSETEHGDEIRDRLAGK